MKDELYKFYNGNHPRPLVLPECRGKSGVKYVSSLSIQSNEIIGHI